jgi:hypothetical protein
MITILICLIGVAPQDCQVETAVSVMHIPNVSGCALSAQATVAQTMLLHEGEYLKIRCRP